MCHSPQLPYVRHVFVNLYRRLGTRKCQLIRPLALSAPVASWGGEQPLLCNGQIAQIRKDSRPMSISHLVKHTAYGAMPSVTAVVSPIHFNVETITKALQCWMFQQSQARVGEAKMFLGQMFAQLKAEALQKLQEIEKAVQEESNRSQVLMLSVDTWRACFALSLCTIGQYKPCFQKLSCPFA